MNQFLTRCLPVAPFAMASESRGGQAAESQTKRVKRYEVTAFTRKDLRDGKRIEDLEAAGRATVFVVAHQDYKTAWELARDACRLGKLPKDGEEGFTEIEPGSLTVKRVMTLDKNSKPNVLSAVEFVRIAQEKGVHLSQKVMDLYEELVPESQRLAPADEEGEEGEGEQAAA